MLFRKLPPSPQPLRWLHIYWSFPGLFSVDPAQGGRLIRSGHRSSYSILAAQKPSISSYRMLMGSRYALIVEDMPKLRRSFAYWLGTSCPLNRIMPSLRYIVSVNVVPPLSESPGVWPIGERESYDGMSYPHLSIEIVIVISVISAHIP